MSLQSYAPPEHGPPSLSLRRCLVSVACRKNGDSNMSLQSYAPPEHGPPSLSLRRCLVSVACRRNGDSNMSLQSYVPPEHGLPSLSTPPPPTPTPYPSVIDGGRKSSVGSVLGSRFCLIQHRVVDPPLCFR